MFARLHQHYSDVYEYVDHYEDSVKYDSEEMLNKYLEDEEEFFPSYTRSRCSSSSFDSSKKGKAKKILKKKKAKFSKVSQQPEFTKENELQEIVKHIKKKIAEYTLSAQELPYLEGYTPRAEGNNLKYDISEIYMERRERFHQCLFCFLSGIMEVTNSSLLEVISVDSLGFDHLKNELNEFIDHEQKIRFLIIQLTKDVSSVQVMMAKREHQKPSTIEDYSEKLLQNARHLKSTYEFMEKLTIKQIYLFVQCQRIMAHLYKSVLDYWKYKYPDNEKIQDIPLPLLSQIESYEFNHPITSLNIDFVMCQIEKVKSHLWVSSRSGEIIVLSRSNGDVPIFKKLKSFKAHSSAIYFLLSIPTRDGIPGSIWTSSECGEFSSWHPDTGNKIKSINLDDPIRTMAIVPQTKKYVIWTTYMNLPIISVWSPNLSVLSQITIPEANDRYITSIKVTNDYVLLLAQRWIYIYTREGEHLFHWKVSDIDSYVDSVDSYVIINRSGIVLYACGTIISTWKICLETKTASKLSTTKISTESIITGIIETPLKLDIDDTEELSIIWVPLCNSTIQLLDSVTLKIINSISLNKTEREIIKSGVFIEDGNIMILGAAAESMRNGTLNLHSTLLWFQSCEPFISQNG